MQKGVKMKKYNPFLRLIFNIKSNRLLKLSLIFFLSLTLNAVSQPKTKTKMKLGEATQIAVGTNDIKTSFDFYKKLGFEKIKEDTLPYPWIQISDGSILILLNQDGQKYIGLHYFARDMDKKVSQLEKMGIRFAQKTQPKGKPFQAIFLSPDSLGVNLISYNPTDMYQPEGFTLRNFPKEDFAKPEKYPNPKCGIFGEFCHPVKDLKKSIEFWEKLGFEALSVNQQPYPWAILSDGLNILGLHQTKDFDYPAITYFAPDMGDRIKKLKEEGIDTITEWKGEGGSTNNVIVTTPEGQKFFLFSF